jgi:hypothetical protein
VTTELAVSHSGGTRSQSCAAPANMRCSVVSLDPPNLIWEQCLKSDSVRFLPRPFVTTVHTIIQPLGYFIRCYTTSVTGIAL